MASEINRKSIDFSTAYPGHQQRKHRKLRITGIFVSDRLTTGVSPAI